MTPYIQFHTQPSHQHQC